jgi:uncharacterized protein
MQIIPHTSQMNSISEHVSFSDGENALSATWTFPRSGKKWPLVVLATGDGPNGSKGQTWTNLVPMLIERGLATFLFDFSGLGDSPGVYRELTLSLGRKNFRGVMKYIQTNGTHDKSRIGVIGASYGGNIALLEAANFPFIKAVGLKSPSSFLPEGYEKQYGSALMAQWGKDGYLESVGLNYTAVLDSLCHNTYAEAAKITVPVRIVHGTDDTAVPIRQVRDLIKILPNGSILEIVGADHWYAEGDQWKTMANDIVQFMASKL